MSEPTSLTKQGVESVSWSLGDGRPWLCMRSVSVSKQYKLMLAKG